MRHILFVEDDAFIRSILCELLRLENFEVTIAINIESAKKKFEEKPFDLILLDLSLPDGNGFDWAKEVIRTHSCPPIIFLTSHTSISDVKRGFELGGADYMKKPVDQEELILRIKRALSDFNTGSGQERQIGEYLYNPTSLVLSHQGKSVMLGQLQGAVLDELSACIGQVVTKNELLNKYWGEANYFTSRNLDSVIVKLRNQFKNDPRIYFASLKRVGYRLLVYNEKLN
ncbi:MAG TPA: response regulator transcription factor [Bacteroidales bacterium]|nr:response regulator transcription factor [Bacteroidales bacterium]